jgi:hypothetical protein
MFKALFGLGWSEILGLLVIGALVFIPIVTVICVVQRPQKKTGEDYD